MYLILSSLPREKTVSHFVTKPCSVLSSTTGDYMQLSPREDFDPAKSECSLLQTPSTHREPCSGRDEF